MLLGKGLLTKAQGQIRKECQKTKMQKVKVNVIILYYIREIDFEANFAVLKSIREGIRRI